MVANAIKKMVESLKNPIFNMGFANFEYNEYDDAYYYKTGYRGYYKLKFKKKYKTEFLKELHNSFKNNLKKDFYYLDLILKNSDVKRFFMWNYQCETFKTARDAFDCFISNCIESEIQESKIEYKIHKI